MRAVKAVILERKGEDAAVLAENGTFMKVHRPGEVGEEIEVAADITPMPRFRQRWIRGLAAAALVLAVAGGAYHYTAVSVSAYVSIDAGGSSVELAVNRLGRVVSVTTVTEDDSGLAETIKSDIRGMRIEDAVPAALDMIAEEGGTTGTDDIVIVGITSESDSSAESLENAIAQSIERPVRTVRVSERDRTEAHSQELGGGLYVYEREEAADSSIAEPEPAGASDAEVFAAITEDDVEMIPEASAREEGETTGAEAPETLAQPAESGTIPRRDDAFMQPAADTAPQEAERPEDTTEPLPERDFGRDNMEYPELRDTSSDEKPDISGNDMPREQMESQNVPPSDMAPPRQGEQPSGMVPPQQGEPSPDAVEPPRQFNGDDTAGQDRMQTPPEPDGFAGQPSGMAMQQAPKGEWQDGSRYSENTF